MESTESPEVTALRQCISALEAALPMLADSNRDLVQSMLAQLKEVASRASQGSYVNWKQVGNEMLRIVEVLHLAHMAVDVAVKTTEASTRRFRS